MKLTTDAPFDADGLLAALAAHATPGCEHTDLAARTHTRVIRLATRPVIVRVHLPRCGTSVTIDTDERERERHDLARVVRGWLDLDAPANTIDAALRDDPIVGPLVAARPGLRVLGSTDWFETLITTIVGQQVSLARARTMNGRLVAAFGTAVDETHTCFPAAAALASVPATELQRHVGLTHARARTVHAVAAAVDGGLSLASAKQRPHALAELRAISGIGQWTIDYLHLRALADRDACPTGDLVLKRALGVTRDADVRNLAHAWRPWRAYAVTHLWTQTAYAAR